MMDFPRRNIPALRQTVLAERMRRNISGAYLTPLRIVSLIDNGITLITVVLLRNNLCVFRAVITVGQIGAAAISAWPFGFPRHRSLHRIQKPPQSIDHDGFHQITFLTVPILAHLCQFVSYYIAKFSPSYRHLIDIL